MKNRISRVLLGLGVVVALGVAVAYMVNPSQSDTLAEVGICTIGLLSLGPLVLWKA